MAIKNLWRSAPQWGLGTALASLLAWNAFLEHFFVPGSLWAQYLWRPAMIDVGQLHEDWSQVFQQQLLQYRKAEEITYLQRLLPEHFIAVEFFYQEHPKKGARCWGRGPGSLSEQQWLSVVGPYGIIGHAQQKKNGFYSIQPIRSKGTRLMLTLSGKEGLFLSEGDGRLLKGIDRDAQLTVGDQLVTMACDPYYPPFYPVAEVMALNFDEQEKVWEFQARPLQPIEHVSYAMIYHRPEGHADAS